MRARAPLFILVAFLTFLAGCNGSDPVAGPAPDPDVVQLAAERAAVAGADAGSASDTLTGLVSALTPVPVSTGNPTTAAARSLSGSGSFQSAGTASTALSCPPPGELDNGVAFTCTDSAGTLTFSFQGSVASPRGTVTLSGSLAATPAEQQPADGTRLDVTFSASASGSAGSATWTGAGFVLVDGAGQVVDFRLSMTHTASSAGGATAVSTVTMSPASLDLLVSAGAVTVRFVLNRPDLSGTVEVNGTLVGNVAMSGGCIVVDYIDGSRPNDTVCP
jgi:hypothetical protein